MNIAKMDWRSISMNVEKILSQMTLEEKVNFCQGANKWETTGVPRLGIPAVWVSDGPIGIRREENAYKENVEGFAPTRKAVCFPAMAGVTASFDPGLAADLGENIADAAKGEQVDVVLGPAANIKRSPLCGRNFEYMSEDPFLAGKIAAGYIKGVQSKKVGTSLKHFAANGQETRRFTISEKISERALREIYLPAFENAVKDAKPWTVMCSYNKINDIFSSHNSWLLTDVLRDDWGYEGLVMSDWVAVNDHARSVSSGLSLEMPRSGDYEDGYLADSVRNGTVSEEELNREVRRLLELTKLCLEGRETAAEYDKGQQHHQARRLARESMVLLKNDGGLLPLEGKTCCFIGDFAQAPRYQGGGSSHIESTEVLSAVDAVRSVAKVSYARGFDADGDSMSDEQLAEAVALAKTTDVAVLFLGLPDAYESEGYDRRHMHLPACQEKLLYEVLKVQPNVCVVLHNGAPVEMPWVDSVPAILEAYLGGQACGGAVVDLLFGAVSPCGKLAETFPLKLEDNPSYLNFPGFRDEVVYAEDIYVGYRYYDKKKMDVLFPFGHGLTYTTFAYDDLKLSSDTFRPGEKLTVSVRVTNTGKTAAKEIVQFYVRPDHEGKPRPVRELKGFGKILLQPGESGTVTAELDDRSFAYWSDETHDWFVEAGRYVIEAAASSRDIRCEESVNVENKPLKLHIGRETFVGDVRRIAGADELLEGFIGKEAFARINPWLCEHALYHVLCMVSQKHIREDDFDALVKKLNDLQK
ncbi:MAG: glycosyl hydrolase [Clostridiales bacterium]|nr:glycosyl hydrolase [Clostridiales bacterium]